MFVSGSDANMIHANSTSISGWLEAESLRGQAFDTSVSHFLTHGTSLDIVLDCSQRNISLRVQLLCSAPGLVSTKVQAGTAMN